MKKVSVIVDGYSGGVSLAPEFKKRGYHCVHVQSDAGLWEKVLPTFDFSFYEKNIVYQGNLNTTLQELKDFEVQCVVPGTETGVELADQLSFHLKVFSNGIEKSAARRNKYLMVEECKKAELKVADQIKTQDLKALLEWAKKHTHERIVLKPLNSAGTEDVYLCHTEQELKNGFESILNKKNILGISNMEVVAQEFLEGTEYFLDTVSFEGGHVFTDIWKYKKRSINGRDFVYDKNELCEHEDPTVQDLRHYALQVLKALDLQYGPAHIELMQTKEGPALVEIGARLDGLTLPTVNQEALGFSAVDATVECYLEPQTFQHRLKNPYQIKKNAMTVYLTSYQEGIFKGFPGKEKLENLSSFFQMTIRAKIDGPLTKTINYFTAPGFLTLIHADKEIIDKDYETIRKLEEEGQLFECG